MGGGKGEQGRLAKSQWCLSIIQDLLKSDSCSGLPRKITRRQPGWIGLDFQKEQPSQVTSRCITLEVWLDTSFREEKPVLSGVCRWVCSHVCGACACAYALVCLGVRIPDDELNAVVVRDTAMMTLQGVCPVGLKFNLSALT